MGHSEFDRAIVAELPTYGYRRIWAILRRITKRMETRLPTISASNRLSVSRRPSFRSSGFRGDTVPILAMRRKSVTIVQNQRNRSAEVNRSHVDATSFHG